MFVQMMSAERDRANTCACGKKKTSGQRPWVKCKSCKKTKCVTCYPSNPDCRDGNCSDCRCQAWGKQRKKEQDKKAREPVTCVICKKTKPRGKMEVLVTKEGKLDMCPKCQATYKAMKEAIYSAREEAVTKDWIPGQERKVVCDHSYSYLSTIPCKKGDRVLVSVSSSYSSMFGGTAKRTVTGFISKYDGPMESVIEVL